MNAEVFDKITGLAREVTVNAIDLDAPSIVRLKLRRAEVGRFEREGDDLIVWLKSGDSIRIADFYETSPNKLTSDLVLIEDDGSMWLARPANGLDFQPISDWDAFLHGSALASDDGAGALLPILGLVGGGGLLAAAAGGGGGSDHDGNPPVSPPPPPPPRPNRPPPPPAARRKLSDPASAGRSSPAGSCEGLGGASLGVSAGSSIFSDFWVSCG